MNIGFFGLLQVVFIVLKLTNSITWSWWLVFVPFYAWLAIFFIVIFFVTWMDKIDPLWRFRK